MSRDQEMGEQEINDLLRHLDDPPPRTSAEQLIDAARAADAREPAAAAPRVWRWAAGVVLLLAFAAAAYAAPGSPIRGWLEAMRDRAGGTSGASETEASPPPAPAPAPDSSGVAVYPGDALTIVFEAAQTSGRLSVALTDGTEVVIRATGRGDAPGFRSGVDRLVVDNRTSSADIDIEIPRSARRVEVQVGGRRVFSSEAGQVRTEVSPDPQGRFVLPWTGGGA